ncbi:MAG: CocE/NonD family hydrolase [Gammaproteobacteria bacterium]|nr:CocE/NonD family hydrolase [Gammaproteobacteria bacterium]
MIDGVEDIENTWIPLADGCRLAARIWLPAGARQRPVPALLEYLPYRKRDFMRARDEPMHRYFAQHGYACMRVDLRGSGDSDGLLFDEYSEQEHTDGVEVIAWLAAQAWCTGAVGMFGISWGGFNSLQIAARRPPALKAVISLCASDDRYRDDAHYMGGCLLTENLQWGAILMMNQALPPDPEIVGDAWREQWRLRLERLPNFPEIWMRQPLRSDYWSAGSVADHIERIAVPVYAIGGWADAYSNAVPRLVQALKVPCKGLIGPWAHTFPHLGVPGPAIGFLQEALRWWDRWLKGQRNGIDQEPVLRVWMQESVTPAPQYAEIPGRWVAETAWPSTRITPEILHLASGGLGTDPGKTEERILSSPQTCGLRGGEWCAFGSDGEMPRDQRPDDGFSLTFDTRRLEKRTEILGAPVVRITLAADQPTANLIVRLCDVAPDGSSLRVSYGVLNLAHRASHSSPKPLEPGEFCSVVLALNDIAHAFPPGHRIRLAISSAYWPIVWPSSAKVHIRILTGKSTLELPVRPPRGEDADLRPFDPPDMAASVPAKRIRHHEFRRRLQVDLTSNDFEYELNGSEFDDASLVHFEDIDLRVGYTLSKRFRIREDDPLSARETIEQRSTLARGSWKITVRMTMTLTATADNFQLHGALQADENDTPLLSRDWDLSLPRRFV